MALENVLSCPICGCTQFKNFLLCQDHTTSQEKFNLLSCFQCNLVFTTPRPNANSIGNYYKSDSYVSHTGSRKGIINYIYTIVRKYTLSWKVSILQEHKKEGTLLDYGCGTGEFIHKCNKSGFDVTGVEPSNDARKKAEILLGKSIASDAHEIVNKKFDLITLWHVLEHVSDLKEKLFHLKSLLNQNGTIFIAVPNHESYDATFYNEYWAGYDVPRHFWHFSKENIKTLLAEVKLNLVEIKPMKLDSYYVSMLSENYLNKEKSALRKFISGLVNGFRSNRYARKNMNYSSLIYIAKL